MRKKLACVFGALLIAGSVAIVSPTPMFAQGSPTVSMVTLQTMPGQNGQQMVVLPRGKVVPLPGAGVNANAVNIYMGSQGGYWYTDKNGQNVDLTSAVQYLQRMQAQGGAGMAGAPVNVPQYAPQPVVNNYYNNENGSGSGGSSSSSGGSAAGTAVAAGLGAATGAALTNALMDTNYNSGYYHGVPYGMPVYYNNHNQPYYVDRGGNNVYVNNQQEYNRNVNASATQNNINNVNNQHVNALNQQQKWYSQQAQNHTEQFSNWQQSKGSENPFVHQDAQNSWANRSANGDNTDGGGRFGRDKNGTADGGGRFGRDKNGTADGGGRFGGGGNDANGGRFAGREASGDGSGTRGGLFGGRDGGNSAGGGGGLLGGRESGGGGRFGGGGGGGLRGRRGR